MKDKKENILVIGGKGKNGSRVVKKLREKGYNAIATDRQQNELKEDERYLDWNNSSTYDGALKDIQRVYIVHPDSSNPEAYEQIKELAARLIKLPILKVVLLSGRGQQAVINYEQVLVGTSLNWTIVRSAWFNQNFSEGHFLEGILSGEISFMAGDVKEPFVDLDDLSDVVVEALLHDEQHNGKIYEVTGEDLLSFKEAIDIIGRHLNHDIKYNFLDKEKYKQLLINKGMSEPEAEQMSHAFSEILDGRNANIGNGVQQVLGRKPKRFIEFVASTPFK